MLRGEKRGRFSPRILMDELLSYKYLAPNGAMTCERG